MLSCDGVPGEEDDPEVGGNGEEEDTPEIRFGAEAGCGAGPGAGAGDGVGAGDRAVEG